MKKALLAIIAVMFGLSMASRTLLAHHSDSVYDQDHLTVITGTVSQFEFVNPHQLIHIDVKDDQGKVVQWVALGGAPNQMRRIGWNSESVKIGEQLTITGFQFRDGRPVMLHLRITRANGEELRPSDVEANFLKAYLANHPNKQ
jgi:uncharacterized protein DUF6152